MVTKVVMPRLSLTMKEGTVVQWFKKEGETVEKGEPLVEVLSEKVTYDIEAPASGILKKILITEGSDAPVNAVLAVITAPDEVLPELAQLLEPISTAPSITQIPEAETTRLETSLTEKIPASPAAKRLAKEHGIDLKSIVGTGPEGRIIEEDVKRFIEERVKWMPKVKKIIPLTGIRKTVAERLSHSFRTAPHSMITMEVDMTNALKLREKYQVSVTEVLVKVVAEALKEHPIINSSLEDNEIKIFEDINIGVAVATEDGLVVVVLRQADKKSINEIASTLRSLIEKARQSKLSKEEITGGTFTITNLGMYGVELFVPIINPPETAILGIGRIVEKPVAINREVKVKPSMTLSLVYDHRVIDGVPAAQFLSKIKQLLESWDT